MTSFTFTVVYGPSRHPEKIPFLNHMRNLKPPDGTRWLILGDFNLIYKVRNKNNRNINLSLMRRFRRTIDYYELKEINLQNRKYTWSNERRRPTLVRLDRFFCNQNWDITFDNCSLQCFVLLPLGPLPSPAVEPIGATSLGSIQIREFLDASPALPRDCDASMEHSD